MATTGRGRPAALASPLPACRGTIREAMTLKSRRHFMKPFQGLHQTRWTATRGALGDPRALLCNRFAVGVIAALRARDRLQDARDRNRQADSAALLT